ncbi:imidazole glycerol phosphate synthase subunit HisH [Herbaspirillum chlorophenolicum]|uniref:Imidazole glycerol phosphate synthase subunit HisH n=1 Tax=Herbaspirillum chlorophenolicum TaxID=211589 RepID=A0ABW8ES79_9BURK
MITIVDYGLGNVQAFANIYKRLNIPVCTAQNAEQLAQAERIILPGVGAFDWAVQRLEATGMRVCLDELVLERKLPVLGVCVGMQIMARRSDEGELPGLGWFDAEVKRFDDSATGKEKMRLPHMGWNDAVQDGAGLFAGLPASRFYFLHSYFFSPGNEEQVLARTDYHGSFASAVRSGNIFGVQFHPEKSHQWGIQLLKNFAEL